MADDAITFPLSSSPGASPAEGAGRLINCAAEPKGENTGPKHVRQPGVSLFATTALSGYRGGLLVGSNLFVPFANRLVMVSSGGVVTDVGALAGTARVSMAKNNLAPTAQVAIVTENGAFLSSAAGAAPIAWPDADLPNPNSVCFQDGFFFFGIGDRRVFATGVNSTAVDSNTFISAQSKSSDTLLRVIPHKGLLWVFCTSSCEIWNDTSNPSPGFPYSRLKTIDRGLIAPNAIAGWEDGFGKLFWVADDFGVYTVDESLQESKVSPPDLDRLIAALSDKTTLEASCYTYAGKSFFVLSSPAWTWEFNVSTGKWNERSSFLGSLLTRWRGTGGTLAFGKWIIGDVQSGNLGFIDPTAFTEFGSPQLFRAESMLVKKFPNRTRVARADFDLVPGQGIATGLDPIQTNPQAGISWSDDGGTTWSNPLMRALGEQAQVRRVYVTNTGITKHIGRRWRFDVTDPVYVGLMGGSQSSSVRAK